MKKYIDLPLAVGFGISNKKQVKMVGENAEIAVIGSKIMNSMNDGGLKAVKKFLKSVL